MGFKRKPSRWCLHPIAAPQSANLVGEGSLFVGVANVLNHTTTENKIKRTIREGHAAGISFEINHAVM